MAARLSVEDRDRRMMRLALREARRGLGRTSPNPVVGAVIVRGDEVIATGCHRRAGQAHAEVVALDHAGQRARGAELFVNLEPCCHHGRTPPCVDTIVRAGVRRVVVGMVDPNPLVNGRGIEALRRAGVAVVSGVEQRACEELNRPFMTAMTLGRPLVTLKLAVTLDGHVAARGGDARWVTGDRARKAVHRLRSEQDALVVGVRTVLVDDPELTCRGVSRPRDPVRVIVDSQLRTPVNARVVRAVEQSTAPTWIVTTRGASERRAAALERAGASVIRVAASRGRVSVRALLAELCRRGMLTALVEGGPTLAGAFWRAHVVDRGLFFVAPKVLGDEQAEPVLRGGGVVRRMAAVTALQDVVVRRFGEDVLIGGWVRPPVGRKRSSATAATRPGEPSQRDEASGS